MPVWVPGKGGETLQLGIQTRGAQIGNNLRIWSEAAEGLELGECADQFRFGAGVAVIAERRIQGQTEAVFTLKSKPGLGSRGMRLDRKRLLRSQNLQQKGQFPRGQFGPASQMPDRVGRDQFPQADLATFAVQL